MASGQAKGSPRTLDLSLEGPAAAYIREEMEGIGGWLSQEEAALFCLVDEVQKAQGIEGWLAELGVWHGRGALLLHFLRRPGEQLFAIDIFDLRSSKHPYFNDPGIFLGHCRRLQADQDTVIIKIDTAATPEMLARSLPTSGSRLFHVDGGHKYEAVRHDMAFAASRLADGGVLSCDDVFTRKFPGVTQALIEMLQENTRLAPFALSRKKAWITTKEHCDPYRQHLAERIGITKVKRSQFMGSTTLIV